MTKQTKIGRQTNFLGHKVSTIYDNSGELGKGYGHTTKESDRNALIDTCTRKRK